MAVLVENIEVVSFEKLCNRCGETKRSGAFNRNKGTKDGLQTQCRACANEYRRTKKTMGRYSGETFENGAEKAKAYRDRRRRLLFQRLGGMCEDCGMLDQRCFEFHHLGKKTFHISGNLMRRWDDLIQEADTCVLLCANCHRVRHSLAG